MKNEVSRMTMNTTKTNISVIHKGAKHQPHEIIAGLMSFATHNNPQRIVGHLKTDPIRREGHLWSPEHLPLG